MMRKLLLLLIVALLSTSGFAQKKAHRSVKRRHHSAHRVKKSTVLPAWAPAHHYDATAYVYFPDFYTYYDPQRGGYTYWDKGKWVFAPSVPPYMKNVDLNKSRIQILKGLSLDLHPELDYPHYMELYPADHKNNMVPVPIPGNPGQ